mgnify:CR=1 FL=1
MRKKLNKVLAVTLSMAVSLPSAPVYAGQPADSKGDVTESETESEAASEQEENEDMEVSIDEPLNVDWDGNELLLSDILGTEEDTIYKDLENEAEKKILIKAISHLSGREQMIIRMRFGLGTADGEEKTQKEVADMLGISQSYISRLEKKIMQRLKREMVKYS